MPDVVLDASVLLALLNSEPGAEVVEAELSRSVISAVNLSEVVAKLADADMPRETIRDALQGLPLEVATFDVDQAFESGLLRPTTRRAGLSLGDRACLSLAQRLNLPALTAERGWEQISVGAEVRLIR